MLSEISQRKTSSTVLYRLHVLPKKYNKLLHVTEKKQNHRYREQISGFQCVCVCVCVQHLFYPSICGWTLRLLPYLGYCK